MHGKKMNFVSDFTLLFPEFQVFEPFYCLYGSLWLPIAPYPFQLFRALELMFNCYLSDLQAEYREFLTDAASDIAMPWPPLD